MELDENQRWVLEGCCAAGSPLAYEILQQFILSFMLFYIDMKLLEEFFWRFGLNCHQ